MRPLPTPGADAGTWGAILNTFLGELLPSGAMVQYVGAAAPTGWLLCDGTSYLRTDYADLFTALGGASSPWGLPDGTHFNVPDLRGRVPVGKGTHVDVDTLAENDGSAVASRRPKHLHTVNESAHTHTVGKSTLDTGTTMAADGGGATEDTFNTGGATTGITVGPQTTAPTDGPAYVVVNYIVKT